MSYASDVALLDDAVRGFSQIMKRPGHWTAVVAQSGVTLDRSAAVILQTLLMNEPRLLHLQDLAQQLGIEPPSITRKTQQLEEAGYLQRSPDPNDGRVTRLQVTSAGKQAAEKLWHAHRQMMHDALTSWPAAERHQFVTLFDRFTKDMVHVSQATTKKG